MSNNAAFVLCMAIFVLGFGGLFAFLFWLGMRD